MEPPSALPTAFAAPRAARCQRFSRAGLWRVSAVPKAPPSLRSGCERGRALLWIPEHRAHRTTAAPNLPLRRVLHPSVGAGAAPALRAAADAHALPALVPNLSVGTGHRTAPGSRLPKETRLRFTLERRKL